MKIKIFFLHSKRKLVAWLKLILRHQTVVETLYQPWSYTGLKTRIRIFRFADSIQCTKKSTRRREDLVLTAMRPLLTVMNGALLYKCTSFKTLLI